MRGRSPDAEAQLVIAKVLARRLWRALSVRVDVATRVFLEDQISRDALRIVDVLFDAAQIVWERHRIFVEPCRPIGVAEQLHFFLAVHPGGETRSITREQLLMMAGLDPEAHA